ncbi:hypothetical protein A2U01_0039752 [Trifolium medium]|uniref:Uncharacterized protein n=1 Tax=Trifolium medium TaxID=97028 RepID=A0A392Q3V8_9FABA|nr:hypothetical protein [Trifolium medium]
MMRIAKDVEEELREEDDEGDKGGGKKSNMGRGDWAGSYQKSRSGLGFQKENNRSNNSGWVNPSQKTGSTNSIQNSTSSLNSTARKGEMERRGGSNDR